MKKGDLLRVGEVVRVLNGKRRGLVGEVVEIDDAADVATVHFAGVVAGETIDSREPFKLANLGRNDK